MKYLALALLLSSFTVTEAVAEQSCKGKQPKKSSPEPLLLAP
jgi:hypothetical protein